MARQLHRLPWVSCGHPYNGYSHAYDDLRGTAHPQLNDEIACCIFYVDQFAKLSGLYPLFCVFTYEMRSTRILRYRPQTPSDHFVDP